MFPLSPTSGAAVALGLVFACIVTASAGTDWHQFRGAEAAGTSDNPALPDTWSATENIAWKSPVPGRGWSSPVVAGDRVILTTAESTGETEPVKEGLYFGGERPPTSDVHAWRVLCLDLATGGTLWERKVHEGIPPHGRHLKNSYASETPVTDGQRVFAYFGNVGLFAFDLDGTPLWERRWEPVETRHGWGTAASPYLHGERIYIINDNDEQSHLTALDALTGDVVWRRDRDEPSNWSPPFVWEHAERTEIVTTGSGRVRSYGLDGEVLWTLAGLSSITVPSPFAAGGLLYLCSGYVGDKDKPLLAIRPGAHGDISLADGETGNAFVAWSDPKAAPYMPTPIHYRDRLYVLLDRGMLSCYDAAAGAEIYTRERLGRSGQFTASPLAYNGHLFCFGERGETIVVRAGDEFEVVRQNELGELIMATPAIAGDALLVRTESHLYCIRNAPQVR